MKNRPLNIVTFNHDNGGSGLYRISGPQKYMQATGGAKFISPSQEFYKYAQPDVIVFQRLYEKHQIEMIREIRNQCPSAFFVYDIDDLLSEIPEKNRARLFHDSKIEDRIKEVISLMDRVVVTTNELKKWVDSLGAKESKVVPNYIFSDQIVEKKNQNKKIRIGWAGSNTHQGDLELLDLALKIKNPDIEWVFFGSKPEAEVEFHPSVPLDQYFSKLSSLDIDLFVAPLEINRFNQAKSDLKLIDAGTVGCAVIATPTEPYKQFNPPVFSWATTPEDWVREIEKFIALPLSQRRSYGVQMQNWVRNKRTYESSDRMGWLPDGGLWTPKAESSSKPLYIVSEDSSGCDFEAKRFNDFTEGANAALKDGADLLYLRAGTILPKSAVVRMRAGMLANSQCVAMSPLASDGNNSFPKLKSMTPMTERNTYKINSLAEDICKNQNGLLFAFYGPALLIRSQGLLIMGVPNFEAYNHVECALTEWTAEAIKARGHVIQVYDCFAGAVCDQKPITKEHIKRFDVMDVTRFIQANSMPMPELLRESLEERFVAESYTGLDYDSPGYNSDYGTWASLKLDPVPKSDGSKVQLYRYGEHQEIDPSKPYAVYCHKDTQIQPFALGMFEDALELNDFVFSDHEALDEKGLAQPVFKPGTDDIFLESSDFMTPICGIKNEGPLERPDLYAKARKGSYHIPHVLGRVPTPTKLDQEYEQGYISAFNNKANLTCETIPTCPGYVFTSRVPTKEKTVTIVTVMENPIFVEPFIAVLNEITSGDFKTIVVSREPLDVPAQNIVGSGSYTDLMNLGISNVETEAFCFLSDGIRPAKEGWLQSVLGNLERPNIGMVGGRVYHISTHIMESGIRVWGGIPSRMFGGELGTQIGVYGLSALSHKSAGASKFFFAMNKATFDQFGLNLSYTQDLAAEDLGCRMIEAGLTNMTDCFASFQLNGVDFNLNQDDVNLFQKNHIGFKDKNFNTNLELDRKDPLSCRFNFLAKVPKPLPSIGQERVLLINDTFDPSHVSMGAFAETKRGNIVFRATLSGFELSLMAPNLQNVRNWDSRDPINIRRALGPDGLQIHRIILCNLIGANGPAAVIEFIRAMGRVGIPFEYVGDKRAQICPRIDMTVNNEPCDNQDYSKGVEHCHNCIMTNNSPFGLVDARAWLSVWMAYLSPRLKEEV